MKKEMNEKKGVKHEEREKGDFEMCFVAPPKWKFGESKERPE